MTSRARKLDAAVHPLAIFEARSEARAMLYSAGEFGLQSAVDVLQHDAVASGLVRMFGQDAVQAIMAEAFRRFRDDNI
jgi:hypothetical protein